MKRLYQLMYAGRGLHGHRSSSELGLRDWALLRTSRPYTARGKAPRTFQSPARRLNGKRQREDRLHNLTASTSMAGS
jgi:hypothetical protein